MEEQQSRWQDIRQNMGCFLPVVILLVLLAYSFHSVVPLVLILLQILFSKHLKKIYSGIAGLTVMVFFSVFAIAWLYSFFSNDTNSSGAKSGDTADETTEVKYDAGSGRDSVWVIHHRKWYTYGNDEYAGDLTVSKSDYLAMKTYREQQLIYDNNNFWPSVYKPLADDTLQRLKRVYETYAGLLNQKPMNREAFAELVVCSIQDIPYELVVEGDCEQFKSKEPEYNQYACLGYTRFGVQSPPEFVYNLHGDCDTRALLLYTVLARFGYDVALMTSETYSHAILGINLPYTGNYKEYHGKKYFTWETTATGCMPGYLSQEWSDMNQWTIDLVSQP